MKTSENGLGSREEYQVITRLRRCGINDLSGGYIIETETGFIGMASDRVQKGDAVCVLFGCRAPLIMRQEGNCWTLIQSAYVCGLMAGEAIEQFRNGTPERRFRIV